MATTKAPPQKALHRGTTVTAVLFAAWSLPALASSGIEVDCDAVEDSDPATTLPVAKLSLAVDLDRSIEATVDEIEATETVRFQPASTPLESPALADSGEAVSNEHDSGDANGESDATTTSVPGTATRLPGISETDFPRIRSRMYRTDI